MTGSSFVGNDLAWLRMHTDRVSSPAEVRDVTLDWSCIALWGPLARQVLQKITEDEVSNQALPYLHAAHINIHGVEVLAQRVSYVGELGWELYVTPERAVQVWDALFAAGQEFDIAVGGYKALDSLRLEKGYRYFTADVTQLENPYAAGLGFCVRLDKGDFIGREALIKAREEGVKRKLCTLVLDEPEFIPLYGGEALYENRRVVSRVRSAGYGHTLQRNILYAYLPIELAQLGTRLKVESFDRRLDAQVGPAVLFDPKGERLRT
jgi:glycine cleavage system aminomethyltransferase T